MFIRINKIYMWQGDLFTCVVVTTWGWHFSAETCSS